MSKTSNIHPVLLFVVIILATTTFGIFGTILAIPVVLVAKTILVHYTDAKG